MARSRKKKKAAAPKPLPDPDRIPNKRTGYVAIHNMGSLYPITATFHEVRTPEMVLIEDTATIRDRDVQGKFVKVAPRIPVSQRASFDAAVIKQTLKQAGAVGIHICPEFVPETKQTRAAEVIEAKDQRELVHEWMGTQHGDAGEKGEAAALVLRFMEEEGL